MFEAFEKESPKIYQANRKLLKTHTARGNLDKEMGPLMTMIEGLNSTNTAIGLLLANRIDGTTNYREAVRKLIESKTGFESLLTEFSGKVPFSMTGPVGFLGRYSPHPVQSSEKGLQLSPELQADLTRMRKIQIGLIKENPEKKLQGFGVGCPIFHNKRCADDMSGMQRFFKMYLRVFEMVDDQLHRKH